MTSSRRVLPAWAGGSSLHPVWARASEGFCSADLAYVGSLGLTYSVLLPSRTGGDIKVPLHLVRFGAHKAFHQPWGLRCSGLGCAAGLTQCR